MMKRYFLVACSAALLALAACSKTKDTPTPGPGGGETEKPDTVRARNVVAWVDARSNVFGTYGRLNDTAGINRERELGSDHVPQRLRHADYHDGRQNHYTRR
jgi:hypothetical protein